LSTPGGYTLQHNIYLETEKMALGAIYFLGTLSQWSFPIFEKIILKWLESTINMENGLIEEFFVVCQHEK
jgi:hypothetical protein